MLTQIKIDSVDVTARLKEYNIDESKDNAISQVTLVFQRGVTDLVSLQQLKSLEIWRGSVTATDEKIFDGFITSVTTDGTKYIIIGSDKLWLSVNTIVNQIYDLTSPQAGIVSEIFKDLINTYVGLTADSTSVQNSGTVNILEKFVVRRANVFEQLKKLADAINWQFYYRADTDKVYFEPKGFTVNSNTLTVGTEILNIPIWIQDSKEFANDIFCYGEFSYVGFQDSYTGDGSTATFTCTKGKPQNVQVTVAGTIKKGGITSATSGAEYTIDKEAQTITFTAGNIPTGGQAIVITYDYVVSLVAHIDSPSSKLTYGRTVQRTFQFSEIKTFADLQLKAQEAITVFKDPFLSSNLKIKNSKIPTLGLRSGQTVTVVDTRNTIAGATINKTFTILTRKLRFPTGFDEISIGDRELKIGDWEAGVEDRLHKLYDEAMQSQDILLEILELGKILTLKRKYLSFERYYINDSFVVGHPVNGIMYNASDTTIIHDFEDNWTDWVEGAGSATLTITNDTVAGHYWVGSQGMNISWTGIATLVNVRNQNVSYDLTGSTGVATGTPTQGTAGIWAWTNVSSALPTIDIRFISSAGNYHEYSGETFAQRIGASQSFAFQNNSLTYVLFNLQSPTITSGTIAWNNITNINIRMSLADEGNFTVDYFTVSKNNKVALNGLGNRVTLRDTSTTTY